MGSNRLGQVVTRSKSTETFSGVIMTIMTHFMRWEPSTLLLVLHFETLKISEGVRDGKEVYDEGFFKLKNGLSVEGVQAFVTILYETKFCLFEIILYSPSTQNYKKFVRGEIT